MAFSGDELLVLLVSGFFTFKFLTAWYRFSLSGAAVRENTFARAVLSLMPVFSFMVVFHTLTTLAASDVVDAPFYILFYALIGFAWLYFGMTLVFLFFDLSWIDDALNVKNPGAALAVAGGGLGVTFIYAGANIGDGPGWWCVFFAGGLGLAAWVILGLFAKRVAKVFWRITVERDGFCGARTGAYLLASGIILGRASAGDWTSFPQTVVEFAAGWPALILAAVFAAVETLFPLPQAHKEKDGYVRAATEKKSNAGDWLISLFVGAIYIAAAIFYVLWINPL